MPCTRPWSTGWDRQVKQTVIITQLADRHADLHRRQFARTDEVTVEAGSTLDVVSEAIRQVPDACEGRCVILVEDPHE